MRALKRKRAKTENSLFFKVQEAQLIYYYKIETKFELN